MSAGEPDWSRWRRPPPTVAEQRWDVWIALGVLFCAMAMLVLVNSMGAFAFGDAPALAEQLAWGVALAVPLAVRRRYPLVVVIIISVVFIGAQVRHIGDNTTPSVALFIAVFTVGAWERNRVVARWSRVGVVIFMFGWLAVSFFRALARPTPAFPAA